LHAAYPAFFYRMTIVGLYRLFLIRSPNCADVPLRNYSLTLIRSHGMEPVHTTIQNGSLSILKRSKLLSNFYRRWCWHIPSFTAV